MHSPVKIWRRQKEVRCLLERKGKIVSWTVQYMVGKGFTNNAPYPVVLVQFTNGDRAVGQLVDYDDADLQYGKKVISILRKVREASPEGVIAYGLKFKPVS